MERPGALLKVVGSEEGSGAEGVAMMGAGGRESFWKEGWRTGGGGEGGGGSQRVERGARKFLLSWS